MGKLIQLAHFQNKENLYKIMFLQKRLVGQK